MGQLRVGGPVPGRKLQPNPQTTSGFPMWNTFQGLGVKSTNREVSIKLRRRDLRGGNSHVHSKRRLDAGNLCHRANPRVDYIHGTAAKLFEDARLTSLKIDRMDDPKARADLYTHLRKIIYEMRDQHLHTWIRRLIQLEHARGRVRIDLIA